LITSWLGGLPTLSLLYRGTKEDLDMVKFREKCGNKKNTLLVLRTEDKQIIGGFNEADWQVTSATKKGEKNFLYNLNKESKYKITNVNSGVHGC